MNQLRILMLVLISVLVLTACNAAETGDDDSDAEAAQNFFPRLSGFTVYETETVQDAITGVAGGAAALTANPALVLLVERVDTLLSCYRDVGAVDANIYVQNVDLNNAAVPLMGALVVINQNRVVGNFASCVSDAPLSGLLRSQAAQPEPCSATGAFNAENGDRIIYAYAASDRPLCNQFDQHFAQFG